MKNEEYGFCRLVFLYGIYGCIVWCVLFITNLLKVDGKMKQVKGYNKLPPRAQKVFQKVYKKHLASMGVEEKKKHSVNNLKKIKINVREKCLEAHFEHDWYKYYPNGTWG